MEKEIVGDIKSVLFGSRVLGSVLSHCSNFIHRNFCWKGDLIISETWIWKACGEPTLEQNIEQRVEESWKEKTHQRFWREWSLWLVKLWRSHGSLNPGNMPLQFSSQLLWGSFRVLGQLLVPHMSKKRVDLEEKLLCGDCMVTAEVCTWMKPFTWCNSSSLWRFHLSSAWRTWRHTYQNYCLSNTVLAGWFSSSASLRTSTAVFSVTPQKGHSNDIKRMAGVSAVLFLRFPEEQVINMHQESILLSCLDCSN